MRRICARELGASREESNSILTSYKLHFSDGLMKLPYTSIPMFQNRGFATRKNFGVSKTRLTLYLFEKVFETCSSIRPPLSELNFVRLGAIYLPIIIGCEKHFRFRSAKRHVGTYYLRRAYILRLRRHSGNGVGCEDHHVVSRSTSTYTYRAVYS